MKNNSSDFQRLDKRADMCYNKIKFFTFFEIFSENRSQNGHQKRYINRGKKI